MVRFDGLSNEALGILVRLLADDPVTGWVLETLNAERQARAAGQHAFPLQIPVMPLEDAQILNRHLIAAAHTLEGLVYGPHDDDGPDAPFLAGAGFLAKVSEDLGKRALAGADKTQ
jgi:hypothetical protein